MTAGQRREATPGIEPGRVGSPESARPASAQVDARSQSVQFATVALGAGVPVKVLSQRLGHADIAVTLRVYAHVMPGDDEAAATRVAGLVLG